jgi:hypothetical protein
MSDHAATLAQLVETLTSDLPFGPKPVEEALGAELERLDRSNQFFTLFEGTCDGTHGVRLAEVRQPSTGSLERGMQGLVLLTTVEGIDEDAMCAAFTDLEPSGIAPMPGDPLDLVELQADRAWGRITVAVDRRTKCVQSVLLDTSP